MFALSEGDWVALQLISLTHVLELDVRDATHYIISFQHDVAAIFRAGGRVITSDLDTASK